MILVSYTIRSCRESLRDTSLVGFFDLGSDLGSDLDVSLNCSLAEEKVLKKKTKKKKEREGMKGRSRGGRMK